MIKFKNMYLVDLLDPQNASYLEDPFDATRIADAIRVGINDIHKNARHDAVDKMLEIREKWSKTHNFEMCDAMLNEITGAIMNLPLRLTTND